MESQACPQNVRGIKTSKGLVIILNLKNRDTLKSTVVVKLIRADFHKSPRNKF